MSKKKKERKSVYATVKRFRKKCPGQWWPERPFKVGEYFLLDGILQKVTSVGHSQKIGKKQPFTKDEAEIMRLLVLAHNKFMGLAKTHETEKTEWIYSFHKLQDLLGARVLRRDYPDIFHKKK